MVERPLDERAQARRRQLLARGIDGRKVGRCSGVAEVVGLDVELVLPQRPAQANPRAWRELRLEPRLVEPRCGDAARGVLHDRLEDREPSTCPPSRRRADDARDRSLLLGPQTRDWRLAERPLVVARPMLEQIANRPQPEPREL